MKVKVKVKIKKLLAVILSGCIIGTTGLLTVSASENPHHTEKVIGTYSTEAEKQAAIEQILAENPNAVIFTDAEEYEQYLASLSSPLSVTVEDVTRARATEKSYRISINTNGMANINVHYSYYVLKGGAVGSVKKDSWYSNYTGVTIGSEYHQDLLTVVKTSSTNIFTTLAFHMDHYILLSGLIKIGSTAQKYTFDHNVQTGKVKTTLIY